MAQETAAHEAFVEQIEDLRASVIQEIMRMCFDMHMEISPDITELFIEYNENGTEVFFGSEMFPIIRGSDRRIYLSEAAHKALD